MTNRRAFFLLLLGLGLALSAGCAVLGSRNPLAVRVRKGRPFAIDETPSASGWGYFSHPFLFVGGLGETYALYNAAGDSSAGWSHRAVSTDRGESWSRMTNAGRAWTVSPGDHDETPVLFCEIVLRGGGLLAHGPLYPNRDTSSAWSFVGFVQRNEGAALWTGQEPAWYAIPPLKHRLYVSSRGAELPDGALISVGYAPAEGESLDSTWALASRDGGRHWEQLARVASPRDAPWGGEGANEPALVLLPDGELLCVMRTGGPSQGGLGASSSPLLEARSRDGGRTWRHRRLPVEGVMPKLLLMGNGVLVLATGRPGNRLYFSVDQGRSWGRELNLTRADAKSTGYCDVVEVASNRLLAVYDVYDTDLKGIWLWEPKEINGVFGVFVEVRPR